MSNLRYAAERLVNMMDSSPETAAFIAERYPGLDHAIDLVRRNLTQTGDGTKPARAGSPEGDAYVPSPPIEQGYRQGVEDSVARGIRVLEGFRDQAITAERKHAYQNAINVLRGLS